MAFRRPKVAPVQLFVLIVTVAIYVALLVVCVNKRDLLSSHSGPHHDRQPTFSGGQQTGSREDEIWQHRRHDVDKFPIHKAQHRLRFAESKAFPNSDVRHTSTNEDGESSLSGDSAAASNDMSSNAIFSGSFADSGPKPRRIQLKDKGPNHYIFEHIYAQPRDVKKHRTNSKDIKFLVPDDSDRGHMDVAQRKYPADMKGNQRNKCRPHTNIVYVKTHKTGSSTLQNIFYRFGDERNLTFALPARGLYIPSAREFNVASILPSSPGVPYNIMANHVRFFEKDIEKLMPKDTKYITIIRRSADQFRSMYLYYTLETQYKATLEQYSINPEYFYEKFGKGKYTQLSGRDPMLFSLGMDKGASQDGSRVQRYIEFLDSKFDLVLILEHLSESLVLLGELLCWDTRSLVHVNNKIRVSLAAEATTVSVEDRRAADDVTKRLNYWNAGDVRLYDHFNRTLWKKIDTYGRSRMSQDVAALNDLCGRYEHECMNGTKVRDISRGSLEHTGLLEYTLNPSKAHNVTCQRLAMVPRAYLEHLREKHIRRYWKDST